MIKPYYQEPNITIYHGDCLEIIPGLPLVDCVIADPPFNVGKNFGSKTNDRQPQEKYWKWFKERFKEISKLVDSGYLYSFHSDKGIYLSRPIIEGTGFEFIQHIIWWGPNGYSSQLHEKGWSWRHEIAQFFKKGDPEGLLVEKGIWFQTVIKANRPQSNFKEGRFHISQKPLHLYRTIIKRMPGGILLDPFMGSGTALLAAKDENLDAIGIDIEEKNCEIAVDRLRQEVLPFAHRD